MRVCFVCSEYPPHPCGGIGRLTQLLARGLVRAGHEARVIGVYPLDDAAPDRQSDEGVQVWRLRSPGYRGGWLAARYRLYRTVRDWARRGEVDLVEVPDYQGWAAGWGRLPVPLVARLSGSGTYFAAEMGQAATRVTRWLERATLRRADYWIAESRYVLAGTAHVFDLAPPAYTVLYNPVELPVQPATARARNRVVFAGTLTAKKGVVALARAWPRVRARCPEAELHVYGRDGAYAGGSMREYLRSLMAADAEAGVQFHGHVSLDELHSVFRQARVAVLPSLAEGFALTPLHAMAAGCPTIYTRRSSGPEVIEHGRDGLLIDPERPETIAEAIVEVLEDDALAERLGRMGRARVEAQFALETAGALNERFYRWCRADFVTVRAPAPHVDRALGVGPVRAPQAPEVAP